MTCIAALVQTITPVIVVAMLASGCNGQQRPAKASPAPPVATATAGSETAPPVARDAPAGAIPIGASPELDASALADVERALNAVDDTGFGVLEQDGQAVTPKTCRQWQSLKARGFQASNTLELQADAGAKKRCGTFEFLARARPSRVSYVKGALESAKPGALPAILATAISREDESAQRAAVTKGQSFAELVPDARIGEARLPQRLTIIEPLAQTRCTLHVEAWGDSDGDGVEDLLVSVLNSVDQGTYFQMRLLRMSRLTAQGPLVVLED